eukprot:TRINITY_DN30651_c0_g1_i1.p1 TRINITY_DN30651_c0_g1~~TRINITY_DN30651_c0_g1_i1.p1  ORF type:complete len:645 (-),score=109.55 TRINITY_DN30651_c0_g1_i1:159-2093(-)
MLAGAAHPTWRLLLEAKDLLSEGASIADILVEEGETDRATFPTTQSVPSLQTLAEHLPDETLFPLQSSTGPALHIVAMVVAVRRVSRELAFVDLVPPGTSFPGDPFAWLAPDGSGKRVRLQLIIGRSLCNRIGSAGAASVIKKIRPRQLLYVAGCVKLEESGEQTGMVRSDPEEVRQKRLAQLDNDIVDVVAEQLRLLEEVHTSSDISSGTARPAGKALSDSSKACDPSSNRPDDDDDDECLELALPKSSVVIVDSADTLERFARVLSERLSGSGDLPVCVGGASDSGQEQEGHDAKQGSIHVVGFDAEWQPCTSTSSRRPIALLQLAFRRSVWLFDMMALRQNRELETRTAELLRRTMTASQLFKVGFGIECDLARLVESFPLAMEEGACSLLDLQSLAAAALPGTNLTGGLSGLCRFVMGKTLDKSQQTSDWECRPLTHAQITYAAQDAHVCVRLFDALCLNHATLAMQPLLPALLALAISWSPSQTSGTNGQGSLLHVDMAVQEAAWRQAAGQRFPGGAPECARWAAGLQDATHYLLPWVGLRNDKRRVCRFANAAVLFLRGEGVDAVGPYLQEGDVDALQDEGVPLVVFVLRSGGWYCAGRGAVSSSGTGTSRSRLILLEANQLAATLIADWAATWHCKG